MAHYFRVQVALDRNNGLGEDVVSNTMHFDSDEVIGANPASWDEAVGGLVSRVETFYQSIGPLLSGVLAGTGTIKVYDMKDPVPRLPRVVETFTHDKGGSGYPSEVALCVSFKANAESGVNPRRRRGRIFVGPLVSTFGAIDAAGSEYRPLAANRTPIMTAFLTMATGINGAARLAIYSPTNVIGNDLDFAMEDAVDVWIDDAFDTIRSRGAKPTSRITGVIT